MIDDQIQLSVLKKLNLSMLLGETKILLYLYKINNQNPYIFKNIKYIKKVLFLLNNALLGYRIRQKFIDSNELNINKKNLEAEAMYSYIKSIQQVGSEKNFFEIELIKYINVFEKIIKGDKDINSELIEKIINLFDDMVENVNLKYQEYIKDYLINNIVECY